MYWIGLIIVSIIWALASMDMNPWFRYGIALLIGVLWFENFGQYA